MSCRARSTRSENENAFRLPQISVFNRQRKIALDARSWKRSPDAHCRLCARARHWANKFATGGRRRHLRSQNQRAASSLHRNRGLPTSSPFSTARFSSASKPLAGRRKQRAQPFSTSWALPRSRSLTPGSTVGNKKIARRWPRCRSESSPLFFRPIGLGVESRASRDMLFVMLPRTVFPFSPCQRPPQTGAF